MRQRLGVVLWWLGTLAGVACVVGSLGMGFSEGAKNMAGLLVAPFLAGPFWAACYIVAGSFWRPPAR